MFLTGDQIQVVNRSAKGEIIKITESEYVVKWQSDSFKEAYSYSKSEVEQMWELLPGSCSHSLVKYTGFSHSYTYCEKCNRK